MSWFKLMPSQQKLQISLYQDVSLTCWKVNNNQRLESGVVWIPTFVVYWLDWDVLLSSQSEPPAELHQSTEADNVAMASESSWWYNSSNMFSGSGQNCDVMSQSGNCHSSLTVIPWKWKLSCCHPAPSFGCWHIVNKVPPRLSQTVSYFPRPETVWKSFH